MKHGNYRKHNDRSHNSSTYHKKDGTPVRAILKREAQTEIKETDMRQSKLSVINRIIKKAEEMGYEDVKLLEGSADSILANMRKKIADGQTRVEEEKPNKLKILRRDRRLTDEEASKYKKIREEIEKDLPDLIERAKKSLENT